MAQEKCLLGFDLGGTKMLATLFDRDLKPIAARKERTPDSGDGDETVRVMIALAQAVLKEANAGQGALQAIGIAVPGLVSSDRKRVKSLTNIGLSDYALATRFESEFGVPAWLENDVRSGVYAELKRGALKGCLSAVGIFIGTGIGGALVLNGELWRGSSGMAGEIGHLVIHENGPKCGCGANGCLEAVASRSAMAKEAVFAASSGKAKTVFESVGTDFRKYKASVFEDALEADEKEIVAIIDRAAARVGLACASVTNLFNPQAILLGGGVVNRIGEYYRKRVKESFDGAVLKDLRGSVKFLLSAHKDQAVSLGAALIALESANGSIPIAESSASLISMVAVMEIGSTGIRLVVAELGPGSAYRIIDRAGKTVPLGRNVFSTGVLSRDTVNRSIQVIAGFRELISGYGLTERETKVIATSALREARNRDLFIDRVARMTGFTVEIVEGVEENHLMYLAVQDALAEVRHNLSRSCSMILEVGGGSTEIMLLRRGRMVAAHSLRIGTVRLERQLSGSIRDLEQVSRFLEENVRSACEMLSRELDLATVKYVVLIGADARFCARRVGKALSESCSEVGRAEYDAFVEEVSRYSTDKIVGKFGLSWAEAEDIVPGLVTAQMFVVNTACERIFVPNVSIREGVLASISKGPDMEVQDEFFSQVVASAVNLGKKYHFDENHAVHVAKTALFLFDEFKIDHGLGRRDRLLLHVAAILHDIGYFIKASGHQRHSEYIVLNSEIFGLHSEDLGILGNLVRFHRKSPPQSSNANFHALTRKDRIAVLKLSALLRVADAMDRGHSQRIASVQVERNGDSVILRTGSTLDLSLERLSLKEKGDLFEDVYGYKVVLS